MATSFALSTRFSASSRLTVRFPQTGLHGLEVRYQILESETAGLDAGLALQWGVCAVQRDIGLQRAARSEERRVGKECRSRWSACHEKRKNVNRCVAGMRSEYM